MGVPWGCVTPLLPSLPGLLCLATPGPPGLFMGGGAKTDVDISARLACLCTPFSAAAAGQAATPLILACAWGLPGGAPLTPALGARCGLLWLPGLVQNLLPPSRQLGPLVRIVGC